MTKLFTLGILSMSMASAQTRPAANPATDLKRNCVRCHSLEVVRAQRLSRDEWEEELNKMVSMGAKVSNRDALLNYLTRKYGTESATGSTK
jgi:hypothetical protein